MGYCNAEELYTFLTTADEGPLSQFANQVFPYMNTEPDFVKVHTDYWDNSRTIDKGMVTMEKVEEFLTNYHSQLCEGQFISWKGFRPWVVVDLTSRLDPDKAWIGWEVETGWRDEEARDRAITAFLTEFEHVCIDNEGGNYGVEFTWTPKEVGAYEEANHPLMFVPRFNRSTEHHDPDDQVGTHINISTPTSRALPSKGLTSVASALNRMLMSMSFEQKETLFGRGRLYGGFFKRGSHSSESAKGEEWLEGKLFNSTYSVPIARKYIAVGDRLAVLMEKVAVAIKEQLDGGAVAARATIEGGFEFLKGSAAEVTVAAVPAERADYQGYDEDYYDDDDDYYDDERSDEGDWCEGCGCYH